MHFWVLLHFIEQQLNLENNVSVSNRELVLKSLIYYGDVETVANPGEFYIAWIRLDGPNISTTVVKGPFETVAEAKKNRFVSGDIVVDSRGIPVFEEDWRFEWEKKELKSWANQIISLAREGKFKEKEVRIYHRIPKNTWWL